MIISPANCIIYHHFELSASSKTVCIVEFLVNAVALM